jgi:hypothetical protein
MSNKTKLLLFALLVILIFSASCSKVTKENYDKLEMGMEYNKVTEFLGDPKSCTESIGVKSCTWGNESKYIEVNFLGDKTLVFKSFGIN